MKESDYQALIRSIEAALQVLGDRPKKGAELTIHADLMRLRETIIRARRDATQGSSGRRDSRSPLGCP